jgi:spermidine synthase/Tfp pilus assembly protein PilF
MIAAMLAIVPLGFASRGRARGARTPWPITLSLAGSTLLGCVAVGFWVAAAPNVLIAQSTASQSPNDRLLSLKEGVEAVVAVTEVPDKGRWLLTNGSPLSAANRMSRRSARALAYIPLLISERPENVLVIGFGIGHTSQAAAAYPTVRRVEIVDPSPEVLAQAGYFRDANGGVLSDRRVSVFVNDGRQHLRMQRTASYDLIAVDPPFLSLAGAGALYSREFYALARTRLKAKGYLSQPLPIYQVSTDALLSMVRAFVDVFPQSVLLGGSGQELMLVGVNDSRLEVAPDRLTAALMQTAAAQTDLQALSLSSALDILGTFVASGQTMVSATQNVRAASDDRPVQEYAASSRLTAIHLGGVPPALVDPGQITAWCPRCYTGGAPAKAVDGLGAYIALLEPLYKWTLPPSDGVGSPSDAQTREIISGNAYIRDLIAEHVARRNARGAALATDGRLDEAIEEFRNVLRLDPDSAETHWNLGRALASRGQIPAAVAELRRSVELDPNQGPPHYDLASTLLDLDQVDGAIDEFRAAIRLMPKAVEAHNNLGIALGRKGRLEEAANEFQEALKLNPNYAEAQHNLASALQAAGSANPGRGAR